MSKIVLTRIDDRLIHGQVVTAWMKLVNANQILIVDEQLVKDAIMQRLLKAAAPPKVTVKVMGVHDAAEFLNSDTSFDQVMILVKTPQTIEGLLQEGTALDTVILGGMASKAGREKFNKNVAASKEEIACMKRILQTGTKLQYQMVPDDVPVDVSKLIKD